MSISIEKCVGFSIRDFLNIGEDPSDLVFRDSQAENSPNYELLVNCSQDRTEFIFLDLQDVCENKPWTDDIVSKWNNNPQKDKYWMNDLVYIPDEVLPNKFYFALYKARININVYNLLSAGDRYQPREIIAQSQP